MRRTLLFGFLCCTLAAPIVSAQSAPDRVQQVESLIRSDRLLAQSEYLADHFGARMTGSPEYDAAAQWAMEEFRRAGLSNVHLESFGIPNGWRRGWARGSLTAPVTRELHMGTVGWAPSTPKGGVEGEVLILDDIAEQKLTTRRTDFAGKIILLDTDKVFVPNFNAAYPRFSHLPQYLKEAGALAILLPDAVPNNVLGDWTDIDNAKARVQPLPMAELGMEDHLLIRRLLKQGPVRLRYEAENQVGGPMQVSNVVAELPGADASGEWLVLGGHLDSWDLASCAQDNGTGVVSVLEVARALASLPRPRRTIRFVLYTGEEPGILGSKMYVAAHRAELPKCVVSLNTDHGAAHPKGWKVEGRRDLLEAMRPISEEQLRRVHGEGLNEEADFDSDYGPFLLAGVPALDLWLDEVPYNLVHHKSSDTSDKIDPLLLRAGAVIVAVTTDILANRPEPIAPHASREEIESILKGAGLLEYLTSRGDWPPAF